MNGRHLREWLEATAACDPAGAYGGLRELAASVSEALPVGEWEGAVRGGDAASLRVALRPCGELGPARAAFARALGLPESALADEPARSRAWVDARWDAKEGRWTRAVAAVRGPRGEELKTLLPETGASRALSRARFSAGDFDEPVASTLAAFHRLCPVAAVQTAAGSEGWTLVLAEPAPWPAFLRTDLSAAFAPRAAQLTLILRDARVVALDFDGEALWARFVG
ncbi:MAG: hypothetical protein HY079_02710 [Elusimicrobia bacterium]|nr:hypothetical protein [Elusimicrobiota bacterium]